MKLLKFVYIMFFLTILNACSDIEETTDDFFPKTVSPGNESEYQISLKMNDDEMFYVQASISIKNISKDSWDTIPFYFIPNVFTHENSPDLEKNSALELTYIDINGESAEYTLNNDSLVVPLKKYVEPNESVNVEISYSFSLPEGGFRFNKNGSNYYLAQWYPMIPTYRNGAGWNKEEFKFKGESYHTPFSTFHIEYDIPENFTVVTSSENDEFPSLNKGTLTVENEKEVFIAILDNPYISESFVGSTNIRVFGQNSTTNDEILKVASQAFQYFQDKIGAYPDKQLDIILDDIGMEYPGVVTAGSVYNRGKVNLSIQKNIVIHEIAHQWFYRMVSSDPYHAPWLDEGITQFATVLFLTEYEDLEFNFVEADYYKEFDLPVNLSLDDYNIHDQSFYFYDKSVVMLGKLFQEDGGKKRAEDFLSHYFENYKYKEVNTKEFIRFIKYYLKLEDDTVFEGWIFLTIL
ncbi:M1 family metallopeptidase [Sutcliffiella sp. NPDC057660]|uniref:M1 family metallopeptidase n=1 Tax=Sutcliffiella sp. NPDC057660 TaxID=3346199 RepID=UPI0036A653B5